MSPCLARVTSTFSLSPADSSFAAGAETGSLGPEPPAAFPEAGSVIMSMLASTTGPQIVCQLREIFQKPGQSRGVSGIRQFPQGFARLIEMLMNAVHGPAEGIVFGQQFQRRRQQRGLPVLNPVLQPRLFRGG